jgi:hypothetical protein
LANDWAPLALSLGWRWEDLFGVNHIAPGARHDDKGLAFLIGDGQQVVALTTWTAAIRTAGGATLTFYRRRDRSRACLAWQLKVTDINRDVSSVRSSPHD